MKKPLKVIQILPALNAGGVERGTAEFSRELVKLGHQSIVISSGGKMVPQLERDGATHIQMKVHRKSLTSLLGVAPLRRLFKEIAPDIIHVRSRIPAWMTWLAWRKIPPDQRPGLVSTFHGMYSVSPYSAIMGKAERIIAISDCVHRYILDNYDVDPAIITRIYRGLDPEAFNTEACDAAWQERIYQQYPEFKEKQIILMPGRLSRWKGQVDFLRMLAILRKTVPNCHGVIVGDAEPNKQHYLQELKEQVSALGLDKSVTFTGHRSDIQAFYGLAQVTCHMSSKPEPFGRTVPEALASGCPVVAYDRGGASESLNDGFPEGLVEPDNISAFAEKVAKIVNQIRPRITLPEDFYLSSQTRKTLDVYYDLLESRQLPARKK